MTEYADLCFPNSGNISSRGTGGQGNSNPTGESQWKGLSLKGTWSHIVHRILESAALRHKELIENNGDFMFSSKWSVLNRQPQLAQLAINIGKSVLENTYTIKLNIYYNNLQLMKCIVRVDGSNSMMLFRLLQLVVLYYILFFYKFNIKSIVHLQRQRRLTFWIIIYKISIQTKFFGLYGDFVNN